MRSFGRCGVALLVAALLSAVPRAQTTHAADLFQQARAREAALRKDIDRVTASSPGAPDLLTRMRTLAHTYEDLWRLFPTSPYSDDALWHGAMLAADAFWQAGDAADRATSLRLFQALRANFPTSSLVKRVPEQVSRLDAAKPGETPTRADVPASSGPSSAAARPSPPRRVTASFTTITAIRRDVLSDVVRVTLDLEREPIFSSERIDGPPRLFIDMQNTRAAESLKDATLPFPDEVVRQIRIGRQLNGRTRVVLDLAGAGRYSVYSLYNPFRIIVDFERTMPASPGAPTLLAQQPALRPSAPRTAPAPPTAAPGASAPVPAAAATNSSGSYSLSRQLGLGIARIVIDPGHGGHDPGAQVKGITEADVTLDIALRLEKLLAKQSGVEVILTRRDDTFIQLQERTAIANRAGADLFLSIHANASEDTSLRGVETYFLNLSPNPEAARIAARENAASSKTMHDVADIVKAIALNDKLDESRDLASIVQASLYDKLKNANRDLRNLGVKQAPFMVLIGATMPSILTEISFITNRQEGSLLKTDKYRQQIAEALYQGVLRYQQSLKKAPAVARQESAPGAATR